jgi:hypothetical protein
VRPETVIVEGPESAVDSIRHLPTEAIPLEAHGEPFVAEVGLVPESPQVRVVGSGGVKVEVLIDAAPVETVIENVPVELPFATNGAAKIRPAKVTVSLSGPPWLIERLEPTQVSAVADLAESDAQGSEKVPLRVELRLSEQRKRFLTVNSVRPDRVSVQVRERTQEQP